MARATARLRATLWGELLAELLGTFILIAFGDGVVAMRRSTAVLLLPPRCLAPRCPDAPGAWRPDAPGAPNPSRRRDCRGLVVGA